MDLLQITGSIIAILLLGWMASKLFVSNPLTDQQIRDYLHQRFPESKIEHIYQNPAKTHAFVCLEGKHEFIAILLMGNHITAKIFSSLDIQRYKISSTALTILFKDFTFKSFEANFLPNEITEIQKRLTQLEAPHAS